MLTWTDLLLSHAFVDEVKPMRSNLRTPDSMRAQSYSVPGARSVPALYLVETS
jgi:hypothetical protein